MVKETKGNLWGVRFPFGNFSLAHPANLKDNKMRKRGNLTEDEKREIERWVCKRKKYHITVGIIAQWNGYHPQYLYAVERFVYPMNEKLRRAYTKVIKVFEKRVKPNVIYTKLKDK